MGSCAWISSITLTSDGVVAPLSKLIAVDVLPSASSISASRPCVCRGAGPKQIKPVRNRDLCHSTGRIRDLCHKVLADLRPLPRALPEMRPLPRPLWQRSRFRLTFPFGDLCHTAGGASLAWKSGPATRPVVRHLPGKAVPATRPWSGRAISRAARLLGRGPVSRGEPRNREPADARARGEVAYPMTLPAAWPQCFGMRDCSNHCEGSYGSESQFRNH